MAYPITYAADFVEKRSRVTTFFRFLLAIPHYVVAAIYGIGVFFAVIFAWLSIVFTGRYPAGLYAFNAGFLHYATRLGGYLYLLTDRYPGFGLGANDDYPVRLHIGPALPEYDRMKTLFRIILMIPVYLIAYALQIVAGVAAIIAWFWILVTGRQNAALQAAINLGFSYNQRAYGYYMLLTETWPPFSDEGAITEGTAPAGVLQQPTTPPPAAPEAPAASSPQVAGLPDRDTPPSAPGMTSGDPLG